MFVMQLEMFFLVYWKMLVFINEHHKVRQDLYDLWNMSELKNNQMASAELAIL